VGFAVIFATFAWLKYKPALVVTSKPQYLASQPTLLVAHLGSITIFGLLSYSGLRYLSSHLFIVGRLVTGLCATVFACIALIPPAFWWRIARATGFLWIWAGAAEIFVFVTLIASPLFWTPDGRRYLAPIASDLATFRRKIRNVHESGPSSPVNDI
ncbi:MAG TPA: hypothetical protein VH088_14005, partial [Terriglobales bacterium]|nr:hypothetical protein [Terriglobales bacterium]